MDTVNSNTRTVYYSNLRQLMAKYGLNKGDIAAIIGKSYRQTLKKLNREKSQSGKVSRFDIEEAKKIVEYFKGMGEPVTADDIFFDNVVTYVTELGNDEREVM